MSETLDAQNEKSKSQLKEYHVKFHELCYQQYMNEFERTNKLHQKTGIWITAMIAIGAAAYVQGNIDLIDKIRVDVFIFLYYCTTLLVWLSLIAGVFFAFQMLLPRNIKRVATMDRWHQWLNDEDNNGDLQDGQREIETGDTFVKALIRDFSDCQRNCFEENEKRTEYFKKLQYSVFLSVLFLAMQSVFSVLVLIVK